MKSLLFVSGWAGFPGLFPGLVPEDSFLLPFVDLDEDGVVRAVERAAASGSHRLLAGWSSGAHMLLKRCVPLFERFDKVLLLAPFARFTAYVPAEAVAALRAGVERSPAAALRGFYRSCGAPAGLPAPAAPATRLAAAAPGLLAGLDYLRVSEAKPVALPGNVVLAHGADDLIVPPAASRELARQGTAQLVVSPGGHYFSPDRIHELLA